MFTDIVVSLPSSVVIFGVALLLGFLSPLIGIFLVMRRFSLLADTLSHVSLLGVALSSLFQLPVAVGAFVSAVVGGMSIELFRQSRRVLSEATLAIFLSGSLALAVMIFAVLGVDAEEIEAYLFGDLSLVVPMDFLLLLILSVVVGLFSLAFSRRLFLTAIDEDLAKVNGVAVNRLNLIFMFLAATAVAAASKIVGVLLVGALMVLPIMAALQWRFGFRQTLWCSLVFSEGAVIGGFGIAYWNDLPSGAAIAATSLLLFLVSYFFNLWRK